MRRLDGELVRCEICEFTENLQYHHRIYQCNGGSDEPENLMVLCERCHRKTHALNGDWVEFGRKGGKARQARLRAELGETRYREYQRVSQRNDGKRKA